MNLFHRVHRINANIRQAPVMPGWLEILERDGDPVFIRWVANLPDNTNPKGTVTMQHGRLYAVFPESTDQQIINTILLAQLTFIEHEVREGFKYNGEHPFMPHH